MVQKKLIAVLEAVLFTMGDSVEVRKLMEITETAKEEVEDALEVLARKYQAEESGISLVRLENAVQLCTKAEYYEYLIKIAKAPRNYVLSDTVLETLSIIAYKQPVTRLEIEKIRGVSCDHAVNKLVEFNLVRELGRLDAPGRPLLFGTTEEFLRCFGVKSLEELPELNTDQMADFQAEAEKEVQLKMEI